jgi:hypothetical protein
MNLYIHNNKLCEALLLNVENYNTRRVLLECFLWGEQAANFLTGVRHNVGLEPNVLIIRNAIYCAAYGNFNIVVHSAI